MKGSEGFVSPKLFLMVAVVMLLGALFAYSRWGTAGLFTPTGPAVADPNLTPSLETETEAPAATPTPTPGEDQGSPSAEATPTTGGSPAPGGSGAPTPTATATPSGGSGSPGATASPTPTPPPTNGPAIVVRTEPVAVGSRGTVEVVLLSADTGLAGFAITVKLDPQAVAIAGIDLPGFGLTNVEWLAESTVRLQGVDIYEVMQPGQDAFTLARLNVEGKLPLRSEVQVQVGRLDDEEGDAIKPTVQSATLEVR